MVNRAAEALNYAAGTGLRAVELGAQDVLERMNHKDEIYELAGQAALSGNVDAVRDMARSEEGTTSFMLSRMASALDSHTEAVAKRDDRTAERATLTPPSHSFLDKRQQRRRQKREYVVLKKAVRQEYVENQIGKNPIKPTGIGYHINRLSEVWGARSEYKKGDITKSEYLDRKMRARINPDNMTDARYQKRLDGKTSKAEKRLRRAENAPLISRAKSMLDSLWEAHQTHKDNVAERNVKQAKRRLDRRVSQPIASRIRTVRRATNERVVALSKEKAAYHQGEYRHLRRKRVGN